VTDVLPDVLVPGLRVVFCGTAVGRQSAAARAYYAHPSNRFWRVLHRTGLTPQVLAPSQYGELPRYGIGLTDLAKRTSGTDDSLSRGAFDVDGFRDRIMRCAPAVVAFNGLTAAQKVLSREGVTYGLQPERIGESLVYVLPSTSGSANAYWDESHWENLADMVRGRVGR
jgi:TDG/mug DNA glycosylase family protein